MQLAPAAPRSNQPSAFVECSLLFNSALSEYSRRLPNLHFPFSRTKTILRCAYDCSFDFRPDVFVRSGFIRASFLPCCVVFTPLRSSGIVALTNTALSYPAIISPSSLSCPGEAAIAWHTFCTNREGGYVLVFWRRLFWHVFRCLSLHRNSLTGSEAHFSDLKLFSTNPTSAAANLSRRLCLIKGWAMPPARLP